MNGLSPTERELPEELGALEFLMKLRRRDETQTPFKEFKFRSCHKEDARKHREAIEAQKDNYHDSDDSIATLAIVLK